MNSEIITLIVLVSVVLLLLAPKAIQEVAWSRGYRGFASKTRTVFPFLSKMYTEAYVEGAGHMGLVHGDNRAASINRNPFASGSAASKAYDAGFRKGEAFRKNLREGNSITSR